MVAGEFRAIIDTAEVVAHSPSASSETVWRLLGALQPTRPLARLCRAFVSRHFGSAPYLAAHWRRGDFARAGTKRTPSAASAALQIRRAAQMHGDALTRYFVATDGSAEERRQLQQHLGDAVVFFDAARDVPADLCDGLHASPTIAAGQCALVEQCICAQAAYFIGTSTSYFTIGIQRQRTAAGRLDSDTYNVFCDDADVMPVGDRRCEQAARWP